jgi:D-3-phosphoglycerate dehydrogenase / 2-oxoglutarate reductase
MPKVLITPTTLTTPDGPYIDLLKQAGFEIVFPKQPRQLTEEDLLSELPGITATLAGSEPYTPRVLAQAKGLKVIARAGVGYDAVDLPAATAHGVAVAITPGANHDAVAEHTFAMLLAAAKNVNNLDRAMRQLKWIRTPTLPLRQRTLGIVGLGRIGKAVALRGAAFYMKVLAYEPFPDRAFIAQQKIDLVPLEKLLAESDFVSLHLPLSAQTQHIINRQTLAQMKPGAWLINTARGGLVNEPDLIAALQAQKIGGAALDVFNQEPLGPSPLYALDNVLLTPHVAGVDEVSRIELAVHAARAIVALSKGEWPAEQIVNAELKGKFRW